MTRDAVQIISGHKILYWKPGKTKHAKTKPKYIRKDSSMSTQYQILNWIRKGWSYHKIIEKLQEMGYKHNVAKRHYSDALHLIEDKIDQTAEQIRDVQIERVENLLQDAVENNDRSAALNALNMLNRIFSLYVDKKEIKAEVNEWTFNYAND